MKLNPIGRAAVVLALAFTAAACGRVKENETATIMNKGAITDTVLKPTLYCMPMCSPYTDIIRYNTFPDTFTISSGRGADAAGGEAKGKQQTESRQVFLRSSDDKFIESISLSVTYEVVKTPTITKLLTEFRADKENGDQNAPLIRDDLQILLTQPLVNTIRSYQALDLQDKGLEIGIKLTESLQKAVDHRLEIKKGEQSPILIKTVILGGVKFDPETEKLLKQKIFAREQGEIADVALLAAKKQSVAAAEQAGVTSKIVETIAKSGAPVDQISSLACLDMQRQKLISDNVQCFPNILRK